MHTYLLVHGYDECAVEEQFAFALRREEASSTGPALGVYKIDFRGHLQFQPKMEQRDLDDEEVDEDDDPWIVDEDYMGLLDDYRQWWPLSFDPPVVMSSRGGGHLREGVEKVATFHDLEAAAKYVWGEFREYDLEGVKILKEQDGRIVEKFEEGNRRIRIKKGISALMASSSG